MSDMRLVRRWWPIVALALLGALAGLAYGLLRPPVYAAKAYVVVVAQNSGDNTAVSYAQAYARIAGQGEVLATAASASNGTATPDELRTSVQASSSPDAPIIEITGSGRPAAHSADLANLVANALTETANRSSSDTQVRLVLLSAAAAPASPASPRPALDVAVGAAAGVLLAGLALLGRSSRTFAGGGQPQVAVGSAPVVPRTRPVPNTGTWDEPLISTEPTSKGSGTGNDDDRTGEENATARGDRGARTGTRRQPGRRVADRNVASRNAAGRGGPQ